MAISFVGQATGTNTATLPAHQAGDLILGFAYRDGNTTAPTVPIGFNWGIIGPASGGNTNSSVLVSKLAASGAETTGTFTNATSVIFLVYRGVDQAIPVWGATSAGAISTTVSYPAVTMKNTGGSSWIVGFAGHRATNTALQTPPTGMTNRATVVDATDEAAAHDTNGGVSSWALATVAVGGTSSGWRSRTLELVAATEGTVDKTLDEIAVVSSGTVETPVADPLGAGPLLLFGMNLQTSVTTTLGAGPGLLFGMNLIVSNPGDPEPDTYSAVISWVPPGDNIDGTPLTDLTGFRIYYGTQSGTYGNTITVNDPDATYYTVSGLTVGTWYFNVKALSADGESAFGVEQAYVVNSENTVEQPYDAYYDIVATVDADLQSTYQVIVLFPVESPLECFYSIIDTASADLSPFWLVSLQATNPWFARLTGGFNTWASTFAGENLYAEASLEAIYGVSGTVDEDYSVVYSISQVGVIDGGGTIPDSVFQSIQPVYQVIGSAQRDLIPVYTVIQGALLDLYAQYQIAAGIPPVEADFTAIWSFGGTVAEDREFLFNIYNPVEQDYAPEFNVLTYAQEDFTSEYDVDSSASNDLTSIYSVFYAVDQVQQDYAGVWTLFDDVSLDLPMQWSNGGYLSQDAVFTYNVVSGWTERPQQSKTWTKKFKYSVWTEVPRPDDSWSE